MHRILVLRSISIIAMRKEKKDLMILCCPECQSTDMYEVAGGYVGQIYRCKKCGYRGSFVLEVDEKDIEALQGNPDEYSAGDTVTR